jgi:hypothetical protein
VCHSLLPLQLIRRPGKDFEVSLKSSRRITIRKNEIGKAVLEFSYVDVGWKWKSGGAVCGTYVPSTSFSCFGRKFCLTVGVTALG